MKRLTLLFMILTATCLCGFSLNTSEKRALVENLKGELPMAKTADDSLKLLYDMFDLSIEEPRAELGYQIMKIGKDKGDNDIILDIIPQIAVLKARDIKALDNLEKEVSALPESDRQKAVKLFVNVEQTIYNARFLSPEQRQDMLVKYFKEDMTPKNNIYEDILDLYRVVVFIRHTTQGHLYLEYLTRLDKMMSDLPECNQFLRNLFYTTAANYYTTNDFPEQAVATDRKLLEIISGLEDHYKKEGREYRDYDRFYYICYRRMLANYEALDMDEVKELFTKCAIMAERDEEIAESFYGDGRVNAYRLLAEKDYKGALPYLKKAIGKTDSRPVKIMLLQQLAEASDSLGDERSHVEALKELNVLLMENRKQKSEEAVIELQMRYDVNKLRSDKSNLEIEKKNLEIGTKQKVISVTLVALFVLVLFLMFLYRSHFRLLSKNRKLGDENRKLQKTIEDILDDGTPHGTTDLKKTSQGEKE